jgi:integrase
MGKLSATGVQQAKGQAKPVKLPDGGGMYLLVNPNGTKYWRYNYRFAGKRKTLALGVYPDTSLADARKAHQKARETLAKDIDPGEAKRIERITRHLASAESFEAVASEWYQAKLQGKSDSYRDRTRRLLKNDLYPSLGTRPISQITSVELLMVLRKVEARGAVDMAHRAKQTAGQVFRYAVATGRAERDPSGDLRGALKSRVKKHYAAITDPVQVGKLLLAIDAFEGTPTVKAALQLSALLFQRPGEIRAMEWAEINWEEERWEIPGEKMKMREPHIVPLSSQAIDLLKDLHPLTGRSRYVFPSARGASRCMSDNAVRVALRTMGYDNDTMTAHGFRAMARTILDEVLNYRVDYIEHQLAHAVKDPNGRAYNRTAHLGERRIMMQGWADYLDNLKAQAKAGNVITAKFGKQQTPESIT